MAFKSKPIAIALTDTVIFTMNATLEGAALLGIGNNTNGAITYTLKFNKASDGVITTIFTNRSMPANDFKKLEIPFLMEAGDQIILSAGTSPGLVAFASVPQNAASPIAQGFVPKGNYSAVATYAINDVVFNVADQTSYLSRTAANINNTPSSSPANWQVFGARGATGSGDFTGPGVSVTSNLIGFNDTTGKVGKDSGVAAANIALLNANNAMSGANSYDKTQVPNRGVITTSVAADFSTKQRWIITMNGAAGVIANPTSPRDGAIYDIALVFTTAHGCSFGNKFKIGDYVPSAIAGQEDRISFEYDATADLYKRRGKANNIGA